MLTAPQVFLAAFARYEVVDGHLTRLTHARNACDGLGLNILRRLAIACERSEEDDMPAAGQVETGAAVLQAEHKHGSGVALVEPLKFSAAPTRGPLQDAHRHGGLTAYLDRALERAAEGPVRLARRNE